MTLSSVGYFWPDQHNYPDGRASWFEAPDYDKRLIDSKSTLRKWRRGVLRGNLEDRLQLPRAYMRGAVRSDLVTKIRSASGGRLFQSQAPDIFLSAKILSFTRKFEISSGLFGIQGATSESNGLQYARDPLAWGRLSERQLALESPVPELLGPGGYARTLQTGYLEILLVAGGRVTAFNAVERITLKRFGIVVEADSSSTAKARSCVDHKLAGHPEGDRPLSHSRFNAHSKLQKVSLSLKYRSRFLRMRLHQIVKLLVSKHYARQVGGVIPDVRALNRIYSRLEAAEMPTSSRLTFVRNFDGIRFKVIPGFVGMKDTTPVALMYRLRPKRLTQHLRLFSN
jgi:hypothetical protein